MRAVLPAAAGPPGELGRFRRGGECFARPEQGLDVDAVFYGVVGDGHRFLLGRQDETFVCAQAVTAVSGVTPTWIYGRAPPGLCLVSDGGGTVCRRMLGYGLLAAGIEEMGGAVGCETRS